MKKLGEVGVIFVLAVTLSFMLFVFEPIVLYANNVDDFWFDLPVLMEPSLLGGLVTLGATLVGGLAVWGLAKLVKKNWIFEIPMLALIDGFLILYIHGNFLSGALPSLNGEVINWGEFKTEMIVSIVICVAVVAATIVLAKKFTLGKTLNGAKYVTLAILAMMSVSLGTVLMTTDALKEKQMVTYATTKDFNTYSKKKNFLILLVDATDSKRFTDATKDLALYDETFEDFTYFPDTAGGYRLTRDSMPLIFSGKWNYNEKDFVEYSTAAFNEAKIFDRLEKEDYTMNYYDEDIMWYSRKSLRFNNFSARTKSVRKLQFLEQEAKYLLFKYLPFPLKKFSQIETLDFKNTSIESDEEPFVWYDLPNYETFKNAEVELVEDKLFQFVHLEGAHVPYNLNEDLEKVEDGTYEQKCVATLKIIKAYLDRVRESGVYDDSAIIVMADHGASLPVNANPILYIKGFGEKHELVVSDKQVWYPDLSENIFDDLLSGKTAGELLSNVGDGHRRRTIILNPWKNEDHMTEYVINGHAWENDLIEETGRRFDR